MSATAGNAIIEYETSQELQDFEQMTSSDRKIFKSSIDIWSGRSGFEPTIRPDGIVAGSSIIYSTGNNNEVATKAFTCYIGGILLSIPADSSVILTRPSSGKAINIIVADSSGVVAVKGSDGTAFSETVGANGGPPEIPENKILVGFVYLDGATAAPITDIMIKQDVTGGHQERYDYPMWLTPANLGDGNIADSSSKETAYVEFSAALPATHSGGTSKKVWGKFYAPIFMEIAEAEDFKPAENAPSSSSKQIYRKTIGAFSQSLGAAGFKVYLMDGISDQIKKLSGELLTFRYRPDQNKPPYSLTQGTIGFATSFPAGDFIAAEVTIAPKFPTVNFDQ